jgi:hypothetical protein
VTAEYLRARVASFYQDMNIEVTDVVVKTSADTYPLEQITNLKAEHRLWSRESEPVLALLIVGFFWFFIDLVQRVSPIILSEAPLSVWEYVMAFLTFVSCVLLLLVAVRLIRGKKFHLTFSQHRAGQRGFALVELATADELDPLEKIAVAIREAQASMKKAG